LILSGALLAATPVLAQVGPAPVRQIISATPLRFPDIKTRGDALIEVELMVNTDGSVADAKIVHSSRTPADDETARNYYLKQRFIPELAENGAPVVSRTVGKIIIKSKIPPHSSIAPDEKLINKEVQRIDRMTCKDFLWEYDIMKAAVHGRRLTYQENLFEISFAMYVSREKVPDAQIASLATLVVDAMESSAKACRDKPEQNFFNSVFEPNLLALGAH